VVVVAGVVVGVGGVVAGVALAAAGVVAGVVLAVVVLAVPGAAAAALLAAALGAAAAWRDTNSTKSTGHPRAQSMPMTCTSRVARTIVSSSTPS
jgi:hypothetical protein